MYQAPDFLSNDMIVQEGWDLIIVLGGDNSFTFVSHWDAGIPILGINSDPKRSVGCLTRLAISDSEDAYDLVEMLDFQEFDVVEWQRLSATIDGKLIVPATSEYFFGEKLRANMSRHVLVYQDMEIEQKSSGIIFATGAGSTGWYRSATKHSKETWAPEKKKAKFVITESYDSPVEHGELGPGEEVILYSLNDGEGYCSSDSWDEFAFTRGSEARVRLDRPLNVVVPRRK